VTKRDSEENRARNRQTPLGSGTESSKDTAKLKGKIIRSTIERERERERERK